MVDKYDAPNGYIAVEATNECDGCIFTYDLYKCLKPSYSSFCVGVYRKDQTNVIFIKEEKEYPIDMLRMDRSRK